MMGLEDIGGLAMHAILSKSGPTEVASIACVGKRFRGWASDDSLWALFCSRELNLTSPLDPHGNLAPSFKAAYQAWRDQFSMYPWPLVLRVKRCWSKIKDWLEVNLPDALPTLRKGASEDEIEDFEKFLNVKLPLPTRVLYRFCDGQELPNEGFSRSLPSSLLGIMGGYTIYDHSVNVYLLPLSQVKFADTRCIVNQLGFSSRSNYLVVASSATDSEKYFLLNCSNGQLFVGTINLITDGEMLPCVPSTLISSVHDPIGSQQQDGLLLWLEEHGRRLQEGIIKVRQQENIRGISLFPEEQPFCSSSITNGVKVRASAVFAPEMSFAMESEKFMFPYSIRLSLSPNGCVIDGVNFSSCQLYWRHWIIRANGVVVTDMNGEGVIGKYPLLRPGEDEFVYESCTPIPSPKGSVEGAFTFVPGRLSDAKGSPFSVEVARFTLELPDYIF